MMKSARFLKDSMDTIYELPIFKKQKNLPKEMQCYRKFQKISLEYQDLEYSFALQQDWDESLNGNLEPEIKGRIIGVKR